MNKKEVRPPMNKDELIDPTLLEDAKAAGFEVEGKVVFGKFRDGGESNITSRLVKFDQLRQARSSLDAELVEKAQAVVDLIDNYHPLEGTLSMTEQVGSLRQAIAKHKGKD